MPEDRKDERVRRIVSFAIVGSIGFLIDAGLLTLLARTYGLNVYFARALSFSAAMTVTWLLNRRKVFQVKRDANRGEEYVRYGFVQIVGALINLGVFTAVLALSPALHDIPVIPLSLGAIFGLLFNYAGATLWVFSRKRGDSG